MLTWSFQFAPVLAPRSSNACEHYMLQFSLVFGNSCWMIEDFCFSAVPPRLADMYLIHILPILLKRLQNPKFIGSYEILRYFQTSSSPIPIAWPLSELETIKKFPQMSKTYAYIGSSNQIHRSSLVLSSPKANKMPRMGGKSPIMYYSRFRELCKAQTMGKSFHREPKERENDEQRMHAPTSKFATQRRVALLLN